MYRKVALSSASKLPVSVIYRVTKYADDTKHLCYYCSNKHHSVHLHFNLNYRRWQNEEKAKYIQNLVQRINIYLKILIQCTFQKAALQPERKQISSLMHEIYVDDYEPRTYKSSNQNCILNKVFKQLNIESNFVFCLLLLHLLLPLHCIDTASYPRLVSIVLRCYLIYKKFIIDLLVLILLHLYIA